jgi:hypothetical protein
MLYLDKGKHDQRLAVLCLRTLNQNLNHDMLGAGFLTGDNPGIPVPTDSVDNIPEVFRYASQFWIDHLVKPEDAHPTLRVELELFLSDHLVHWLEVVSFRWQLRRLEPIRAWVLVSVRHQINYHKNQILAILGRRVRFISRLQVIPPSGNIRRAI